MNTAANEWNPSWCWSTSSGNTNEHSYQSFFHILDKMEIFKCPGPPYWCRWCYSLKWCCHLVRERLKSTFIFIPEMYPQWLEIWDTQVRNGQGGELDICSPSPEPALWTQRGEDRQHCQELRILQSKLTLGGVEYSNCSGTFKTKRTCISGGNESRGTTGSSC